MKHLIAYMVFTIICISKALGIQCYHCGRVAGNRCEIMDNLPERNCPDWSAEEKLSLGIQKSVCVRIERIIKNKTFYDRKCGQIGGENDTCSLEEEKYEGVNLTCITCELDWCNGSPTCYLNFLFLLSSIIFVTTMKKV